MQCQRLKNRVDMQEAESHRRVLSDAELEKTVYLLCEMKKLVPLGQKNSGLFGTFISFYFVMHFRGTVV